MPGGWQGQRKQYLNVLWKTRGNLHKLLKTKSEYFYGHKKFLFLDVSGKLVFLLRSGAMSSLVFEDQLNYFKQIHNLLGLPKM